MDYRYFSAAAIICILFLLIAIVILFSLSLKWKRICESKDGILKEQATRTEELNRAVLNFSSLYEQSQETCRKRTEFYSNITHELKTPLSVILGAIQLLERKREQQTEEDGLVSRNLKVIRNNCYRMLRLTNNLLDLTKLEAGYLSLKPVNCSLDALVEEIVQSVVPYAAQRQLELSCIRPPEPVLTAVDTEKIERIVLNLLSNSIKFTKPGGMIRVATGIADGRATISVKDTGVGIPPAMQEEIFVRFKQAGEHPVLEKEGYGIGLSLVKSFVALHQGGIRILSEKDHGSEFIIDLPITRIEEPTAETVETCRIPDVEDSCFRIREAATIEFAGMHPIAS